MNNLIKISKLNKSFEGLKKINVLKSISYIFKKGKIYSLMGPSGSGKELIARKIHKKSKRNKEPFIIINGALLDSNKYELELSSKSTK